MSLEPDKIDGVKLSSVQRYTYRRMIQCLTEQAGWDDATAVKLAEPAFRKSHEQRNGEWRAKRDVQLADAHGTIRSCRFWREENAARGQQR